MFEKRFGYLAVVRFFREVERTRHVPPQLIAFDQRRIVYRRVAP
jgi:hypothetical protein